MENQCFLDSFLRHCLCLIEDHILCLEHCLSSLLILGLLMIMRHPCIPVPSRGWNGLQELLSTWPSVVWLGTLKLLQFELRLTTKPSSHSRGSGIMSNTTSRVSQYAPANETPFDIWYETLNLDGAILVAVAYGKREHITILMNMLIRSTYQGSMPRCSSPGLSHYGSGVRSDLSKHGECWLTYVLIFY